MADSVALDRAAPVSVDLARNPVVGLTGEGACDVARAVVAQLVGLRSPRDLRLVVLAPEHRSEWEWTKWLPHADRSARSEGERFGGCAIAADDAEATTLFAELVAEVERRAAAADERIGGGRAAGADGGPHTVVVLQPPVGLSPAAVAGFLERAPAVGVSMLYITGDGHGLPGEVSVHVRLSDGTESAEVHHLSDGTTPAAVTPWRITASAATALARDLAPLVDVTLSAGANAIPATAPLVSLHDDPTVLFDGGAMARRWAADSPGLVATLGADAEGAVLVDLQADGPHGLVAGTTGSGKSELLQSVIADLAARHSPLDLNFILVDYKGGSAFRECERLPHTVGFVTDLDEHLADRALVSLRAELRHREQVLAELGVGDLAALRARYRHSVNADLVLPSLVIVIDEFAALRAEVPEFVDGLVDVAQRGRSMGVHMILATQKPGGVITPQIDANTNIRVALRVATEADSRDLIGVTDAAHVAVDRPGRALLKIGGGSAVTPFQAAYVGGHTTLGRPARRSGIAPFDAGLYPGRFRPVEVVGSHDHSEPLGAAAGADAGRDLGRIVAAAVGAWEASVHQRELRRPWLPPLPAMVPLEAVTGAGAVAAGGDGGRVRVPIGLADLPSAQAQEPYLLDLGRAGNVAVYGAPGSGKTTLLRTLACSLSSGDPIAVYGVDFGSGLGAIDALPTVADVVGGSELERLQLLVAFLEREVSDRLAAGGGRPGAPTPIVVLIDGFGSFWDTMESFDFGRQADRFARLLGQGPSVGVHFVLTADQRSAIPFSCLGSIGARLLQRLASVDEYRSLGLGASPNPEAMVPGRTLVVDGPEVQVASVDEAALSRIVEQLRAAGVTAAGPPITALGDRVRLAEISRPSDLASVAIGLGPARDEVTVDLVDQPTMLVAGPPGSGRSTVLLTLIEQLSTVVGAVRIMVGKPTSPLAGRSAGAVAAGTCDDAVAAFSELAAEIDERSRSRI